MPIVVAADDKERYTTLYRVGRFQIRIVGARHRMVVLSSELILRESQPDETVVSPIGNSADQFVDRRSVALGLVVGLGRSPPASDQPGLLLVCRDAVYQLLAPIARRIGELLRLVFLSQCWRSVD